METEQQIERLGAASFRFGTVHQSTVRACHPETMPDAFRMTAMPF